MCLLRYHILIYVLGTLHIPVSSFVDDRVDIDLRLGIVTGYSPYISFLTAPVSSLRRTCAKQAVVKINLSGEYRGAMFRLDYGEKPRLWTLDIANSPRGDGYGGELGNASDMSEAHIHNRQLRIYGNDLPEFHANRNNGDLLLRVVDKIVKQGTKLTLDVSNERIEWAANGRKHFLQSKHLFNFVENERNGKIYAGFNRVVAGDFRHGAGLCRVVITLYKQAERDRCLRGNNNCHKDAICISARRSYRCKCKPGFYGTGKICIDEDECNFQNGDCVHSCSNTAGNYSCHCYKGFQLADDQHNCIDINECLEHKGDCQHQCINTLGSYECRCNSGYSLADNGRSCLLGAWCIKAYACQHTCIKHKYSVQCACHRGYVLHQNGRDCIQTCSVGNGGCQHICNNTALTAQGPRCHCAPKYTLNYDNKTCTASCGVKNGGCQKKCDDTADGPKCSCPRGYSLHQDGRNCLDVNECEKNNGGCSHRCVNTHGSFECVCPKGYKVNMGEKKCKDVDECEGNMTCDHICINTPGSYHCLCTKGYQLYGKTHCADINDCSINNGGCQHMCINKLGGYECRCKPGYHLHTNKKDCVIAGKCLPLKAPAKAQLTCSHRSEEKEESCRLQCIHNAHFTASSKKSFTFVCGLSTNYEWRHQTSNISLPSCSEAVTAPSMVRHARFKFRTQKCNMVEYQKIQFKRNLVNEILFQKRYHCTESCHVNAVQLSCRPTRRRFKRQKHKHKFRHYGSKDENTVLAKFELQVSPQLNKGMCNVACMKRQTKRRLKKMIQKMRKYINKEQFFVMYENSKYKVSRRSFKASRIKLMCAAGQVLVLDKCVACSVGTYYDVSRHQCVECPEATYQDQEGRLSCKACPNAVKGSGMTGAMNKSECEALCDPGYYSEDGFEPCSPCQIGFFQADYGRTTCIPCGKSIRTSGLASTGFHDCIVRDVCRVGFYYVKDSHICEPCPRGTYQAKTGQNFCVSCPGETNTDSTGSRNSTFCKDTKCGGHNKKHLGFIQSPNYPGDYPNNAQCTWVIKPVKGRRILIIIPEIDLPSEDQCGDQLVMRKSASPYSPTTYESCKSTEKPIAFTARSRKLWIQFRSNEKNTAAGFSIPYVMYNEEYEGLIEDIVRDRRLYSSHQHQELLKDRKMLNVLLEIIADPRRYTAYTNVSRTVVPRSLFRLLASKVIKFFS